jgi:hypothetical protein
MMRLSLYAAILAAGVGCAGAAHADVLSQDQFMMRNTGDLVALCGSAESDPLFTAAQNFCDGFIVGTYRTVAAVQEAFPRRGKKLICPPAVMPTRNEAAAAFVKWAGANPNSAALAPTDGFVLFLSQTYPCK